MFTRKNCEATNECIDDNQAISGFEGSIITS